MAITHATTATGAPLIGADDWNAAHDGAPTLAEVLTEGNDVDGHSITSATVGNNEGAYLQLLAGTVFFGGGATVHGGYGGDGSGGGVTLQGGDGSGAGEAAALTVLAGDVDTHGLVQIKSDGATGSAGEVLTADGAGTSAWAAPAGAVPVGGIIMWSGTIATIPATWALCDGTANAPGPDLRDTFVVGAKQDAAGAAKTNLTGALTVSGGSISHDHTATDSAVGNHDALTNNHAGSAVGTSAAGSSHTHTASGDHTSHTHDAHAIGAQGTVAWPAGVPTNAGHTHDNHGFTNLADHSALTNNHAGTAVADPAGEAAHTHAKGTIAASGDAATTATGSSGAVKPTAAHVHTITGSTAAGASHTHTQGAVTQPTAHGAISAHSGGATTPTTHSSIAPVISWPAGVPTHSGTTVTPATHSADSGTALSHGALGNESTHTHAAGTVTQPSAHAAISAHAVTQPTISSDAAPMPYFALAYIQRIS